MTSENGQAGQTSDLCCLPEVTTAHVIPIQRESVVRLRHAPRIMSFDLVRFASGEGRGQEPMTVLRRHDQGAGIKTSSPDRVQRT